MYHNRFIKKVHKTFKLSESLHLLIYVRGQEDLEFEGNKTNYEPTNLQWYANRQTFPSGEDVACLVHRCCDEDKWKETFHGGQLRYLRDEEWLALSLHIGDLYRELKVNIRENVQATLPTRPSNIRIIETQLRMLPLGDTVVTKDETRILSPTKKVISTLHRTAPATCRRSERHRERLNCYCGLSSHWVISVAHYATQIYSKPQYVKKVTWVWTDTELFIEEEEVKAIINVLPEIETYFNSPLKSYSQ